MTHDERLLKTMQLTETISAKIKQFQKPEKKVQQNDIKHCRIVGCFWRCKILIQPKSNHF